MTEIGMAIDIAIFADHGVDPLKGTNSSTYELTTLKVLPVPPPHPLLSLLDVDLTAPSLPGVWRFEAITERVRRRDDATGAGHLLVNFLNVEEGQEAAVNAWFVEEHLPDLLALPGFVSGQRYQAGGDQDLPYTLLNLWEVEPTVAVSSLQGQRAEREDALRFGRQPKVRVHPALLADQRMGGIYRPASV